jgi:hypothetical protein
LKVVWTKKSPRLIKAEKIALMSVLAIVLFCLIPYASAQSGTLSITVNSGVIFASPTLNATVGADFTCNYIYMDNATLTVNFNSPTICRSDPLGIPYIQTDGGDTVIVTVIGSGNVTIYFESTSGTGGVLLPATLVNFIIFLLILIIPTMISWSYFGSIAVAPMLILMTIISYMANLVPFVFVILVGIVAIGILFRKQMPVINRGSG